jgi:hypothetical protein
MIELRDYKRTAVRRRFSKNSFGKYISSTRAQPGLGAVRFALTASQCRWLRWLTFHGGTRYACQPEG